MKILGVLFLVSFCLLRAGDAIAESPYAAKCEQVIGVPVPDVDCSNPRGNEVSVGAIRHGVDEGKCDNPSYGLSGCIPGTRFIRYDDTISRNGRTEKITTYVMCRKTSTNVPRDQYDDIGVIQYNETKHATCWFSSTGNNIPSKTIGKRKAYPSPSTREGNDFWGANQPASNCVECHQAGVFLRTPFAAGVRPEAGKGFKRTGGRGAYQAGDGNDIPFSTKFAKRGLSCSVNIPEWNRPNGTSAPISIKINTRNWPPAGYTEPPGIGGNANACTRCHYVGFRTGEAAGVVPSCKAFLSEFKDGERFSLRASSGNHFWMPRNDAPATLAQMQQRFGRSLEALAWCCNDANKANNRDYAATCNDKFTDADDDDEFRVQTSLKERGACALCRDCVEKPRGNGGNPQRTH